MILAQNEFGLDGDQKIVLSLTLLRSVVVRVEIGVCSGSCLSQAVALIPHYPLGANAYLGI